MFQQSTPKQYQSGMNEIELSDLQKNSIMDKIYNSDIYREFLKQWGNPNSQSVSNYHQDTQNQKPL